MTHIAFIRHGITDWNIIRRLQGQSDIPLNETGRLQARSLANRLMYEEWDYIFSSDLSRAKETADTVAQSLGLPVHVDQRLREKQFGLLEGTTLEERIEKWGNDWGSLALGGEDEETTAERGVSFLSEITEKYPGKKIIVVSHGALIRLTLKKLVPHKMTEGHLLNTSVTLLTHMKSAWDCPLYNCAKHITEL